MGLIALEYADVLNAEGEKKLLEFSSDLLEGPYNAASLFVIRVDGASMEPKINDRALLVADLSQKTLQDDDLYLVYKDERMWIKVYKQTEEAGSFVSLNPAFSHLVYGADEVRVVAKALLAFNPL